MQQSPSLRRPPGLDLGAVTAALASPRVLALAICGLLLTAVYAAATLAIPLPDFFPGPGISLGFPQMLGDDWVRVSVQYTGVVIASFALYGAALAVVWGSRGRVPAVVLYGFPVLFVLVLAWMYPPTAVDMFHYQADARTFWVHGQNPLTVAPAANPYAIGISWAEQPSPYGPFWSLLTFVPALLPGDHYLAGLILFKLMAGGFLLGCAWLIARLVARTRPGWEAVALVLFAWNPFVLLRVAGNGHNDLVMMFFVLLALERAHRRNWTAVFPLLALSVLVKFVTALLGPMFLLYAWTHTPGTARERLRALAPGLGLAALVVVASYLPFWEGRDTFSTLKNQVSGLMITSTPLLLQERLARGMAPDEATSRALLLTRLAFAALYLPLVWQARRDFGRLAACGVNALFLYLVIATAWFRPWYMLWPLALAALLPGTWYTTLFLAISFCCSFPDLVEQYRGNWDWLAAGYWRLLVAPIAVQFWVPVVVWLVGLTSFRSWHFDAPAALRLSRPPPDAGATAGG